MTNAENPFVPSIRAADLLPRGGRVIDVRKSAARRADPRCLAGAEWIDPFDLNHDHPVMEADGPITFFCVAGHEVSQFACALARVHRVDAVFIEGGLIALAKAGLVQ
jgi:rhodanese-related sulfurtransferase